MPEPAGTRPRRKRGGRGSNPVARTAQIARRRERRGRLARLTLIAGTVAVLALIAGYQFWLRDSSLVAINNLTVKGLDPKDERDRPVEEAVRLAVDQMTTLHPRPGLLAGDLERFPRVAHSSIETSLPDSATVTLTMRRDGATIGSGAGARLIATDGTVLGPAGDREESLPEIGSSAPSPETGRLDGTELAQALVLGGVPDKLRPYTDSSRQGPGGVEVTLSNGLVLAFGDPTQIDLKWRAAAAVIADPGLTDAVYVDLAVPRRPAVRTTASDVEGQEDIPAAGAEEVPAG